MSADSGIRNKTWYVLSIVIFVFLLQIPASLFAVDGEVKVRGYVKTLATLSDLTGLDLDFSGSGEDEPTYEASSINTLRLNLFWQASQSATVELAYELIPRIQDPDGSESLFSIRAADPLSYRAGDFGEKVYTSHDGSDFQLFHNLDRALITLSPSFGDIYIGRQPVAFGSARVINTTDIFTSFTYTELNNEERIGVDAVRIRVPAGALGEIDVGTVFGNKFSSKESAAFVRAKFFTLETDISPIAILFKENLLLGVDIARSVGDAGYWLEGAYTFADITDHHDPDQSYLRISTGIDYSFTDKLYSYIEYHFNEAGRSNADDYNRILSAPVQETAYQEGAVYLFGKHYIAPGISYQISPLLNVNAGALYNIRDGSVLLFPVFQYSLSDEASIEAGAFAGFGKKSTIAWNSSAAALSISSESEFGLYPDTYFISAKRYF